MKICYGYISDTSFDIWDFFALNFHHDKDHTLWVFVCLPHLPPPLCLEALTPDAIKALVSSSIFSANMCTVSMIWLYTVWRSLWILLDELLLNEPEQKKGHQ